MYSGALMKNDKNFTSNFPLMSIHQKYQLELLIRGLFENSKIDLEDIRNKYYLDEVNIIEREKTTVKEKMEKLSKIQDNPHALDMIAYHHMFSGNPDNALPYITQLMNMNLDSGVYLLGMFHYEAKDYETAFNCFIKIAERYKDAMIMLAVMYNDGDFVEQDVRKSILYAERAEKMPQKRPITNVSVLGSLILRNHNFLNV
jgi:TPR repeat protein